jgi:hypothetical protein
MTDYFESFDIGEPGPRTIAEKRLAAFIIEVFRFIEDGYVDQKELEAIRKKGHDLLRELGLLDAGQ